MIALTGASARAMGCVPELKEPTQAALRTEPANSPKSESSMLRSPSGSDRKA